MADLKNPRLIIVKGFLFLIGSILACVILLMDRPDLRTAALLAAAIWCFCRFYYFAFYVLQNYVDPTYRFSGLSAFVAYFVRGRRGDGQ